METGDLQINHNTNAIDLQNLQYRKSVEAHSTWVEWGFSYFTSVKMIKDVYELSKVVSPQQTIRQIATYTVGPLTQRLDKARGLEGDGIKYFPLPYGYRMGEGIQYFPLPCCYSMLGTLATETLTASVNPAQWAASKAINYVSTALAGRLNSYLELEKKGKLGMEAAGLIKISGSLIAQKTIKKVEKTEVVESAYEKINKPLQIISKPIDTFINKGISNGLDTLGVSTTKPLGLTAADIELERRLVASENKVTDMEEKIDELKTKENELQEQIAKESKTTDEINQGARQKIEKARKFQKSCPDKKHRKSNKVLAKHVSEDCASEYNISKQQRGEINDDIVRNLHLKRGEEECNNAMKEVIVKHETMLQNKSKMQLEDVKRAQADTKCKLGKAKQQYKSEKDKFDAGTNSYQQAKYKSDQQNRNKLKSKKSLTAEDMCSGNIQLTISPKDLKEIEDRLNRYLEEQNYSKRNLNDLKNKLFINGKIKISHDSMGNLGLVVPIKIDNKREYLNKVTEINAELYFNVHLSDSSADQIIGARIADATHKLSKKPYFKLFSTYELMRVGGMTSNTLEPVLNQTIQDFHADMDNFFRRDNILNEFNRNLPEGFTVLPGALNVRSRVDNSDNHVFDIDCNADVQCKIPVDALKDVFEGYEIAGCRFEKISNIKMTNGRVEIEIPLTGTLNGSIVTSFDLNYCSEQRRLSFSNLNVTPQENASSLLTFCTSAVNGLQGILSGYVEGYINTNLENMPLLSTSYAQQRFQSEIPGTLNVDADSIAINNINFDNSITLDASLRSNM